jgi:hypothetical protein
MNLARVHLLAHTNVTTPKTTMKIFQASSRRRLTWCFVDLTWHNPNTPVLAEGPEITIKPVGIRHISAGEVDTRDGQPSSPPRSKT